MIARNDLLLSPFALPERRLNNDKQKQSKNNCHKPKIQDKPQQKNLNFKSEQPCAAKVALKQRQSSGSIKTLNVFA